MRVRRMLNGCRPSLDLHNTFCFQCLTAKTLEKFLIFSYHQTAFYKLLEVVYNMHIYLFSVLSIHFKSTGTYKEKKKSMNLRETFNNIAITLFPPVKIMSHIALSIREAKCSTWQSKTIQIKHIETEKIVSWWNRGLATAKHNLTWKWEISDRIRSKIQRANIVSAAVLNIHK